jgi:hypothetical protein
MDHYEIQYVISTYRLINEVVLRNIDHMEFDHKMYKQNQDY